MKDLKKKLEGTVNIFFGTKWIKENERGIKYISIPYKYLLKAILPLLEKAKDKWKFNNHVTHQHFVGVVEFLGYLEELLEEK